MSKHEVLSHARRLVQEAVDVQTGLASTRHMWSRSTVRKPPRLKLMDMVEVQAS